MPGSPCDAVCSPVWKTLVGVSVCCEAAGWIATIAEALHHAHRHGVVHRDIKPANILLDATDAPFVADFGLALKEADFGKGAAFAGTPAYMSPEQARGEGHRVDGRSDIFSLGVVFYEMLVGRRPFKADSQQELLEQISSVDVRPPRQVNDAIPRELERICLKALSKRASDRYTTATDMADDLRHWICSLDKTAGPAAMNSVQTAIEPALEPEPLAASRVKKLVFLSYATPDKDAAYRLCRLLEERDVGCWIAPRDVAAGTDYAEAIIRGIEATPTTVLLLSAHSNASIHVKHEVERATSKLKRVIPVRLADIMPGPALELHLATAQWVDAWNRSLEQVAAHLALVLQGGAGATPLPSVAALPLPIPTAPPPSDSRPIKILPKGLRSFDAHDADFFLELLPGPRERSPTTTAGTMCVSRCSATNMRYQAKVDLAGMRRRAKTHRRTSRAR